MIIHDKFSFIKPNEKSLVFSKMGGSLCYLSREKSEDGFTVFRFRNFETHSLCNSTEYISIEEAIRVFKPIWDFYEFNDRVEAMMFLTLKLDMDQDKVRTNKLFNNLFKSGADFDDYLWENGDKFTHKKEVPPEHIVNFL